MRNKQEFKNEQKERLSQNELLLFFNVPGHFHFICDRIEEGDIFFGETEAKHMSGVLRYSVGDEISFTDGKGIIGTARLTSLKKKEAQARIIDQKLSRRTNHLTLCIGILRQNDRMEWLVEKCTEFGVEHIVFMQCTNSQKGKINMTRMHKKAFAAVKQSHGSFLPKLEVSSFKEAAQLKGHKYIAFCKEQMEKRSLHEMEQSAVVYIGPEGDFTDEEIEMAFEQQSVGLDLGSNILRTETAALLVCGVHYL